MLNFWPALYILMVTYYQVKSYKRLCSAHNVPTTSVVLAQPSDDVKLKISVLLTSPTKGHPNAEEILGPFSRLRRFKILKLSSKTISFASSSVSVI